eukprot:m.27117 g.27117  ORF g.27117 m.27117 type:complete len:256 (-) comp7864_c0_seq1:88-855(-)
MKSFQIVVGETPLVGTTSALVITCAMFVLSSMLKAYMSSRTKAFSFASTAAMLNNFFFACVSALLFVAVAFEAQSTGSFGSLDSFLCHRENSRTSRLQFLYYAFYLSKLWEFLDILFVAMQKAPVAWQFQWHHCTTFLAVFIGIKSQSSLDLLSMLTNTFHHIWMYLFFSNRNTFKIFVPVMLVTGTLQLLLGVLGLLYATHSIYYDVKDPCEGDLQANLFLLLLYCSYLYLWVEDLVRVANGETKQEAAARKEQ